eukprot:15352125-Ditylum_brightwellii.AAC.1
MGGLRVQLLYVEPLGEGNFPCILDIGDKLRGQESAQVVSQCFVKAVDTSLVPVEESVRCKLLDLVHIAQYATVHMGNRMSSICFLEPSWVAVRLSGGLGCKGPP